jgi:hypothetical protein
VVTVTVSPEWSRCTGVASAGGNAAPAVPTHNDKPVHKPPVHTVSAADDIVSVNVYAPFRMLKTGAEVAGAVGGEPAPQPGRRSGNRGGTMNLASFLMRLIRNSNDSARYWTRWIRQ